jgi:hypothetical protein
MSRSQRSEVGKTLLPFGKKPSKRNPNDCALLIFDVDLIKGSFDEREGLIRFNSAAAFFTIPFDFD